jgi:hypothetical protein
MRVEKTTTVDDIADGDETFQCLLSLRKMSTKLSIPDTNTHNCVILQSLYLVKY